VQVVGGAGVAAVLAVGGTLILTTGGDDSDQPSPVATDVRTVESTTVTTSPTVSSVATTTTTVAAEPTPIASFGSAPFVIGDSGGTRENIDFHFTPDGTRIVARVNETEVVVLNAVTGDEVLRLDGAAGGAKLVISPDGTRAFAGSALWDLDTGGVITTLPRARNPVLSPDGSSMAVETDCDVRCVAVLDLRSGTRRYEIDNPPDPAFVTAAGELGPSMVPAFSPDGQWIVMASGVGETNDWPILIFDASSGAFVRSIRALLFGDVYFSADGTRIAINGPGLHLYDFTTGEAAAGWIPSPEWGSSPDGRLAIGDNAVLDRETGEVVVRLSEANFFASSDIQPEFDGSGDRILGPLTTLSPDGGERSLISVGVWDARTGELITTLAGTDKTTAGFDDAAPVSAHFSPDGSRIVTRSYDGTLTVWATP
jgi:WD40 repeat protein